MKTTDGYRFTLQFSANSDDYIRAGEVLERLRHKKSDLVVRAICEYLDRHPEIEAGVPVRIEIRKELLRRDELEAIVRDIVERYSPIAKDAVPNLQNKPPQSNGQQQEAINIAVNMMLDGLDDFFQ